MLCDNPCPVTCGPGHTYCPGEFDGNGCQMPNTCLPPAPGKIERKFSNLAIKRLRVLEKVNELKCDKNIWYVSR